MKLKAKYVHIFFLLLAAHIPPSSSLISLYTSNLNKMRLAALTLRVQNLENLHNERVVKDAMQDQLIERHETRITELEDRVTRISNLVHGK